MSTTSKPRGLRSKSGPRPMTFTGCWTCKRRKVKCDERPGRCMKCERMGISCGGYGVKLQWMTDPFAESRPPHNQSRGRIRINRNYGPVYSMKTIEEFLSALENDAEHFISSHKGPFNVFAYPKEQATHAEDHEPESQIAILPRVTADLRDGGQTSASFSAFLGDDEYVQNSNYFSTHCQALVSSPELPSSSFSQPLLPEAIAHTLGAENDASPFLIGDDDSLEELPPATDFQGDRTTASQEGELVDEQHTFAITASRDSALHMPKSRNWVGATALHTVSRSMLAISQDTNVNRLMHHYAVHVAGLLQPIDHPLNPYRTLYVPAALTAASGPPHSTAGTLDANKTIHYVLLHSLMASSAFHMWNCNPVQTQYHKVGSQQRRKALSLLNCALERQPTSIEYKTLMMAMLSLVSIDIMSGCEADFVVHLRGTKQLQKRRRDWRIISKTTRQLNQISDFLFLLTRTTYFPTSTFSSSKSMYDFDEEGETALDTKTESCYPYMYGTSPTLASHILETCRLAEKLARYEHDSTEIPDVLLEASENLGDRILSWSLEMDNVQIPAGNRLAMDIFRPHIKAWHLAIISYYFRRIHKCRDPDYAQNIRTIAECMHLVEDIKERSRSQFTSQMAPITWPAFIASCEGVFREQWTQWWQRIQCYQIANIRMQWETVQNIWQQKDEMTWAGRQDEFDWIEVFKGCELTLMPI